MENRCVYDRDYGERPRSPSQRSRSALGRGALPPEHPEEATVEFHAAALDGRYPDQAPANRLGRQVAAIQLASVDE
jgi:hypothetical protein